MTRQRTYKTRASWMRQRNKYVGASDSAKICGLGSAMDLYQEKTSAEPPTGTPTVAMEIGQIIEPSLLEIFGRVTGKTAVRPGTASEIVVHQHEVYPFIRATLDAELWDERAVVELKNVGQYNRDEWRDGVPLKYEVQIQHQMMVRGWEHGYLFGLVGGNEPIVRHVEAHKEFQLALLLKIKTFWGCVVDGVPPQTDGTVETTRALGRLHPEDNGRAISLPDDVDAMASGLDGLKAQRKSCDEQIRETENKIRASIGSSTYGVGRSAVYSWKSQTRRSYEVSESTTRVLRKVKCLPSSISIEGEQNGHETKSISHDKNEQDTGHDPEKCEHDAGSDAEALDTGAAGAGSGNVNQG